MNQKVILNSGDGAWAFQELAESLADHFKVEISNVPEDFNYVLSWDEANIQAMSSTSFAIVSKMFIPWQIIKLASDKRLLVDVFIRNKIAIPENHLIDTHQEVLDFLHDTTEQWCLKYPI